MPGQPGQPGPGAPAPAPEQHPLPPWLQYKPDPDLVRLHQQLSYQVEQLERLVRTSNHIHVKPALEQHISPLFQSLAAMVIGVQTDLVAYIGSLSQYNKHMENAATEFIVGIMPEEAEAMQDDLDTAVAPLRELLGTSEAPDFEPPPWEVVKPLLVEMVETVHAVAEGLDEITLSDDELEKLEGTAEGEDYPMGVIPEATAPDDGYTDEPLIAP
jgi:hypothetical protein